MLKRATANGYFLTWLIGVLASTAAVIGLVLAVPGVFVSLGGLAIVAIAALAAGIAAAGLAAPDRFGPNVSIVAFYIVVLAAIYFLVLPALAGPDPPGVQRGGGPGVYPPQRDGAPGTYPPVR